MASIIVPAVPSESRAGRFGVYGGREVPVSRIAARGGGAGQRHLAHGGGAGGVGARVRSGQGGRGVSGGVGRSAEKLCRAADGALLLQAFERAVGRGEDLFE